ncbi:MAG: hypothetical protein WBQ76_05975, partial [Candidatus Korobacteraceae bacterium]
YMRGAVNPNIREQDVRKQSLLCGDCEQLFSGWEREFSWRAFPLIQDDNFEELAYGSWLLKFAVSLSWRTLVTDRDAMIKDLPQFTRPVTETLERWRRFLLGLQKSTGSEHHLFVVAGIPKSLPPGLHPKFLHYLMRSIDATEAVSDRTVAVYVKLLRAIFYSPIVPAHPGGWRNTRIHAEEGRLGQHQVVSMGGFLEFLQSRVEEVYAKPITESQAKKIAEAMLKNPERVLASESMKVHFASRRLFGKG